MRILVVGASGYLGYAVASALARAGHEVHGLVRRPEVANMLRKAEIQPLMGKLQEPASFTAAAAQCSVIIYAAADYQVDTLAADRAAIEALLGVAARGPKPKTFIYTSGVWVHGDTGDAMADETTPLAPPRAVQARPAIEQLVLEHPQVRGLVIRPGDVYGGRGGLTGMWFEGAEKGELRVIGDGRNRWPLVHVDDLADAYVRLAESGLSREVFNVTDRSRAAVNEIAEAVVRATGSKAKITHVPLAEATKQMGAFAECLALNQHVDSRKAVQRLGWQPRHGGFVDAAEIYYQAWKAWS
ncbi:MAG: NAD-dependent epimerase/dehydratase family protein [Gammaproteobacteria bacterium]